MLGPWYPSVIKAIIEHKKKQTMSTCDSHIAVHVSSAENSTPQCYPQASRVSTANQIYFVVNQSARHDVLTVQTAAILWSGRSHVSNVRLCQC